MIRRSLLVAAVLTVLGVVGQANADTFTTGLVTVNPGPGGTTASNVEVIGNSQATTANAWTADVTSTAGNLGDTVHLLAAVPLVSSTTNGINNGNFPAAGQVIAIIGMTGTFTSANTPTFTSGTALIVNRGTAAGFSGIDPASWTPAGSTTLGTLSLVANPGITSVQSGGTINGFQTDSPLVPNPGAINQDPVVVGPNAALTSNPDFLFSALNGAPFLTNFNTVNNANPEILSLINAQILGAGGMNPTAPTAAELAAANALFLALQGTTFATTFNPTSPQNAGFNFQTLATITGGQEDPGAVAPALPPGVPEPASMLLWGAVVAGLGLARKLRRAKSPVA